MKSVYINIWNSSWPVIIEALKNVSCYYSHYRHFLRFTKKIRKVSKIQKLFMIYDLIRMTLAME